MNITNGFRFAIAVVIALLVSQVARTSASELDQSISLLARWSPQEDRSFVVKVMTLSGNAGGSAQLTVVDGAKQIFSTLAQDEPYSAFCTSGPNPRLVTVWTSGSGAYHVRVFALRGDKVVQVLEAGSKLLPEFVYPTPVPADVSQRIVIPKGEWRVDRNTSVAALVPSSADVYTWSGSEYRVTKDVPWSNRFATPK